MRLRVKSVDFNILNMHNRLPFRYGIVTLTALPHLFVRLELEDGGMRRAVGMSADHLPPKWFTKDPNTHFRDDLVDMVDVIRSASHLAMGLEAAASPFDLWDRLYAAQKEWASSKPYPPLLWNFGVSLIERAVIDAFCRMEQIPFSRALRQDRLGITQAFLQGLGTQLLPREPLRRVIARHTVGMTDPIEESDIPPDQKLSDGLPQSLDQCIRAYGLKHFKIKLSGNVEGDARRLRKLAGVISRLAPEDFAFSLDANENFKELGPFRALWEGLSSEPSLKEFLSRLIFIEQPLHRDVALSPGVKAAMHDWPGRPPMIIDESDAELQSLPQALDCGYSGTSHKNCKGIFKSIRNACILENQRRQHPEARFIFSGEDLSNIGPVALLQDLAVAANLGIWSIERNAQHYFRGVAMLPRELQQALLDRHGDLYHTNASGLVTMNIRDGALDIGTLVDSAMGVGFDFDSRQFTPLDQWRFDSLGLK